MLSGAKLKPMTLIVRMPARVMLFGRFSTR